ncbi:MAG: lysostaphin resistance A-like protein [Victivallaceae bacterium]
MKFSVGSCSRFEVPWAAELPRIALWLILPASFLLLAVSPELALLALLALIGVAGGYGNLEGKLSRRVAPLRSYWHLCWLLPLVVVGNGVLTILWVLAFKKIGFPIDSEQDVARLLYDSDGVARFRLLFLVLVVAPVFEELFYRRLLFNLLLPLGGLVAFVVTALIFSLSHGFAAGIPALFLLGSMFQYTYLKNGDILYPIIFHILFNLNSTLMIIFLGMV